MQKLREGVVRDMHRQEMKKIQNLKMLQDQQELTKILTAQRAADQEAQRYKRQGFHLHTPLQSTIHN